MDEKTTNRPEDMEDRITQTQRETNERTRTIDTVKKMIKLNPS
jgi:hypothetical protein